MKGMFDMKTAMVAIALCGATALPMVSQAQTRWDVRIQGGYRGGYQGGYQGRRPVIRQWMYRDIKSLADRTERESNSLRARFERDMGHYRWGQRESADDAKHMIQRMDEAMEDFRRAVDSHRAWSGRDELQRAIRNARDVKYMFNHYDAVRDSLRGYWSPLREDLNALAAMYNIEGL